MQDLQLRLSILKRIAITCLLLLLIRLNCGIGAEITGCDGNELCLKQLNDCFIQIVFSANG